MADRERYLGDGVYATFDGFSVTLDLRGQDNTTRIVLEPEVLDALVKFRQACQEPADARPSE